jgi:hypothetical protein
VQNYKCDIEFRGSLFLRKIRTNKSSGYIQVIVNNLTCEQAIAACHLCGTIPLSTLYSCVISTQDRGTYNVLKLREEKEIKRLVIQIHDHIVVDPNDKDSCVAGLSLSEPDPTILPVTMLSTTTAATEESIATTGDSSSSGKGKTSRRRFRKSPKQAIVVHLQAKVDKVEYDNRYKPAFKEAVALVAGAVANTNPAEPDKDICDRLNAKYGLGISAYQEHKLPSRKTWDGWTKSKEKRATAGYL